MDTTGDIALLRQRMQWVIKHCTYIEHTDANGAAAYTQPENEGFWPPHNDDGSEISLIEYIDDQIKKGRS